MIDFSDAFERDLRLLIERLRYERFVAGRVASLVQAVFEDVVDKILSREFRDLTPFQKKRTGELYAALEKIIDDGYANIPTVLVKEMRGVASLEAEVVRATVRGVLASSGVDVSRMASLPKAYLESIAKSPIMGKDAGAWFEEQARTMTFQTQRIIQQGLIEGKGPLQIAPKIVAADTAKEAPLVRRARREAVTIARTSVNAVQNDAQFQQMSRLPASVSDRYVWESVLDSRTSTICQALSGRVFRYDDPRRRLPPAHPGCRSAIRALLVGIDYSLKDQSEPRTLRTYSDWLTKQPATKQNEIMGRSRADLFRSGKLSLDQFINEDSKVLTLKQLRERITSRDVATV